MKRVLIVYNACSSRFDRVREEVLEKIKKFDGLMVGRYEINNTDVDRNSDKLAQLIQNDDLVIAAGGDATATIAGNGVLKSKKHAKLAVLPYGNFNDLARTLGMRRLEEIFDQRAVLRDFYPLEIIVDGKFFRYAFCYATIGMMAEATRIFDQPKMRKILKTNLGRSLGSYVNLAKWYFKHRHRTFLPEMRINHQTQEVFSDYLAVNGKFMAYIMKGRESFRETEKFYSTTGNFVRFWTLMKFMCQSVFKQIPGMVTKEDELELKVPGTVILQSEGERRELRRIQKIEIRKSSQSVQVFERKN